MVATELGQNLRSAGLRLYGCVLHNFCLKSTILFLLRRPKMDINAINTTLSLKLTNVFQ